MVATCATTSAIVERDLKREEKSMSRRAGRPRNYTLLFNDGFLKR